MASSLFGIGISGLNTAQAGLLTTSHNISNVHTPGFSRQAIVQGSNNPQYTGVGFFGNGAHVQTVKREYNAFLEVQARETQASASHLQRYASQIGRIDQLLGDVESGLSAAFDNFFEGVNAVASYPRDPAARQSMLSGGNALVSRFKVLETQLSDARKDVNSQLQAGVTEINSIASRIAELNDRIAVYSAQGTGSQLPNDLLDQRDTLVRDLNKLIGANVVEQSDGSYNVFIGNGQALVVRNRANSLSVVDDPQVLGDKQIMLNSGGVQMRLSAAQLTGGELGGLLEFRDQTLNTAHNALGRIALNLAEAFNQQHRLGQDLNGLPGGDYFTVGAPRIHPDDGAVSVALSNVADLTTSDYRLSYDGTDYTLTRLPENVSMTITAEVTSGTEVAGHGITIIIDPLNPMAAGDSYIIQPTRGGAAGLAMAIHDPQAIAAASPIRTAAALDNAGSATISTGNVLPGYTPSGATHTITFGEVGGVMHYSIDGDTPVQYVSGQAIEFNNIEFTLSGVPAEGDVFTIEPNTGGQTDNRNAILLAALQTRDLMAGGTATLQGGYAQLVADIGNKTRELQVTGDAQAAMLKETMAARESVSGVNLDEEAANLMRYQQAYQASGKVIAIAGSLFDSILDIMR